MLFVYLAILGWSMLYQIYTKYYYEYVKQRNAIIAFLTVELITLVVFILWTFLKTYEYPLFEIDQVYYEA